VLPFTREVYIRLLEHYNAAIWPVQIIALGLGIIVLLLILKPRIGGDRFIAAILAGAWIWTGIVYHGMFLAPLNWAATASGGLFALQGALLAWTGLLRGRLAFRFLPTPRAWAGLAFAVLALAAPLAGPLTDLGWSRAPAIGIASGPTALFTLGVLLLADGRTPVRLLLIPLLWTGIAGVSAWLLRLPHDLILPVAGITAAWLAFIPRNAWRS
jgi:Family of unknown function (DUF6064)